MLILITGATGQLGKELVKITSNNHQVRGVSSSDFDITDLASTGEYISELDPDVIVHSAAYTDVDGCEENEDKAYKVNGLGARNVAIVAREVGAKIVHISTDYVFDGKGQDPYREFDSPNPQSVYGESKLLGEQFIKEQLPRHYICRVAWLYGEQGDNFLKSMLDLVGVKEKLEVVDDQFGSPTWTKNVALQIEELISGKAFGTYHCTSQGSCNWYEFALEIFKNAGYKLKPLEKEGVELVDEAGNITQVKPVPSEKFERPAPRPRSSILENYMLDLQGLNKMPYWENSLSKFIDSYCL